MPCVIVVVSIISDGVQYGKNQAAEKVSRQVDTLGELGSNRNSWLERNLI